MNCPDKQAAWLPVVVAIFASIQAQAATEYLRIEGFITSNADTLEIAGYSDVFVASQPIYFDLMIDTELDPPGWSDDMYSNVFQSTLVGGTLGSDQMQYGVVGRTVEYFYSELVLNGPLYLEGPSINCDTGDELPQVCFDQPPLILDFTWNVGTEVALWTSGFDNLGILPDTIGTLVVTYRGSIPPVPLPGALVLFLSAFSAIGLARTNIAK